MLAWVLLDRHKLKPASWFLWEEFQESTRQRRCDVLIRVITVHQKMTGNRSWLTVPAKVGFYHSSYN